MEELVSSTVIKELKNAWAGRIAAPDLIELLYDGVAEPIGLLNKNKDTFNVTKTDASRIVNRKKYGNALKAIREGASMPIVKENIESYFKDSILPHIHTEKIGDLIFHLSRVIEGDPYISNSKKKELLDMADETHAAKFLGYTYLYSLSRDNEQKEVRFKSDQDKEAFMNKPLEKIPVPESLGTVERKYADALLAIYGQLEDREDFDEGVLESYPRYKEHFDDQREYYFAAEAVRRGTRDVYITEDQFEELKDETYEGVKETWEEEYDNGMIRLRRVTTQASNTRVDR